MNKLLERIKSAPNRINRRIVKKIRCWLGIPEDLKYICDETDKFIRIINNSISRVDEKVDINRTTLASVVEISTDVTINHRHSNETSWAMVSIGGKIQRIKFVNLGKQNYMEIVHFLKRYEAGKHVINSPSPYAFLDHLYYFGSDNSFR